jgi:hypothetical protein
MKTMIELFEKTFMLNGENEDPRDVDFTFYTHEKIISNPDGTPSEKQYFMTYDPGTDAFSNLAVYCNYTYTYDSGVLIKRVEDIDWFFSDGTVGVSKQLIQVFE